MTKRHKKAFTMIELLVIITIIAIMFFASNNLIFTKTQDSKKLEIFVNKIVSIFDTAKNYSLTWKWIWTNLETPNYWKLKIQKRASFRKHNGEFRYQLVLCQGNAPFYSSSGIHHQQHHIEIGLWNSNHGFVLLM